MQLTHFRNLSQRGDTIVEVLIAIAVVSAVLVAASATTTRNINSEQDTQERTQALQLAQAQLEYLRSTTTPLGGNSCFTPGGPSVGTPASGTSCTIDNAGTVPGATQPTYTIAVASIAPLLPTTLPTYTVQVTWTGITNRTSQPNKVTLYYQH